MRRKSLFATFALAISLLATGCGAGDKSNNLELIYFGKPKEEQTENINYKYQLPKRANEEPEDQYYYLENYGDQGVVLDAVIKNNDRLSFLDIVLYSASTGKRYVYSAGAGDYIVEASTERSDDVWTTRLRFQWIGWDIYGKESDKCFFDTYLEIEEINFLTLNGAVTRTNITNSNIKRVNVHVVDGREENHNWAQWENRERSCEDYASRYRYCPDCGREQNDIDWEQPPYGHDCDGWTIENKTPGVLQQGDIFHGVGNCKRCNQPASCVLPKLSANNYSLTIPNDITRIGKEAFWDSFGLVSVTIPNTVSKIGERAFGYCHDLKTVVFGSAVPPEIGGDLFSGTWDYDDFFIYVPAGSGNAYRSITADCWEWSAVSHIIEVGNGVTINCNDGNGHDWIWTLDSGYSTIYSDSFAHKECEKCGAKMTSFSLNELRDRYDNGNAKLVIPEGVTRIENNAFERCRFMSSVVFPTTLTNVGYDAFRECYNLISVEFNNQVPPIFDGRFLGDTYSINNDLVIYVPCGCAEAYVDAIITNSWSEYNYLTNRIVGHKVTRWTTTQEPTCEENGTKTGVCSVCNQEATVAIAALGHDYDYSTETEKYINTPCGQMRVKETTCRRCGFVKSEELSNLNHTWAWSFPLNITSITRQSPVIRECTLCGSKTDSTLENELYSMTSIVIPNTVTRIEYEAFNDANRLESITIPSSVTSLGERAFGNCNNMLSVYFESTTPPQIGGDLFCGTWNREEFKIYVPCGYGYAYEAVQADFWDNAISHIVGDHTFGDWVITKNPVDCSEIGEKERTCSRCGYVQKVDIQLPHSYGEPVTVESESGGISYKKETCTVDGNQRITIKSLDGTPASGTTYNSSVASGYLRINAGGSISWTFDYDGAAIGTLYQKGYIDYYDYWIANERNNDKTYYHTSHKNSEPSDTPSFTYSINDEPIDMTAMTYFTYEDMLKDGEVVSGLGDYASPVALCKVGEVLLQPGTNTLKYEKINNLGLYTSELVLELKPLPIDHEHQVSSEWSHDATYHWKTCVDSECPYRNLKIDKGPHTWSEWVLDSENDCYVRECSVCGLTQTRKYNLDTMTNSDGKTVNFSYEDNTTYESIAISDGTFVSGSINSDGKMASSTDVKWHLPVFDAGKVAIQLSMKMSQDSHGSQSFDPTKYTIKVNGVEQHITIPSGSTYSGIGLTTNTQYFTFAEYEITETDIQNGEIEIEFIHNVSGWRLLFDGNIRLVYSW